MEENKQIIEILKKLMSYQTIKENDMAFEQVFEYIKSILPNSLIVREHNFNGNKALVISNTLAKTFDLVFSTHVDVVPIDDYTVTITEDKVIGRGAIDMKGGLAVCLEALINCKSAKKIALFITSDEEIDGYSTEQLLTIYDTEFAIIPDGGKNFELIKEEKGMIQVKIAIETKSAHASKPYEGVNAITALLQLYEDLCAIYPLPVSSEDYRTSINLSIINGGDANNKVPSKAFMILDIRHISSDSKEILLDTIKKLNNKVVVEIIAAGSLFKTDVNDNHIKDYLAVATSVLGRKIKIVATESTSDGIYFSDKKIPAVIMNPTGDNPHCPNEYVYKEGLYKLYKIYEQVLKNI